MILKPISNLAINAADIVEFMQWKLIDYKYSKHMKSKIVPLGKTDISTGSMGCGTELTQFCNSEGEYGFNVLRLITTPHTSKK
jgi:hypothetical protein